MIANLYNSGCLADKTPLDMLVQSVPISRESMQRQGD
jgi:hypothetical protein